jgi:uncharacterized protein HemX
LTTTEATRSPVRLGTLAVAMALAGAILLPAAGYAQTRGGQTDEERREEVFRNGEQAADQRTQSQRSITGGQQERLGYQIRRAKRANRQMQCRSAGLPKDC